MFSFAYRLCLREFAIEILRSTFNTMVNQVRRQLDRDVDMGSNDDQFLLWAIQFFMAFNRLSDMKLELVW